MTARKPKKSGTWQEDFRATEAAVNATVFDADPKPGKCAGCRQVRPIFQVHLFRAEHRPVIDRCKDCALSLAGGKIHIGSTRGPWLKGWWQKDQCMPKRDFSAAAIEAFRSRSQKKGRNIPPLPEVPVDAECG